MTDGIKPAWGNTIYQQLALYLQQVDANSKASAKKRSELLAWLHREAGEALDERSMREEIAQGVMRGEFPVICSGPTGYYVTQDPVEIKAAIDYLDTRQEKLAVRLAGLRSAHREAVRREMEQARGEQDSGHRVQGTLFSAGPQR